MPAAVCVSKPVTGSIVRSTVVLYEAGLDSPTLGQPMVNIDCDFVRTKRFPAVRLMF